jgi:hypothetical protein
MCFYLSNVDFEIRLVPKSPVSGCGRGLVISASLQGSAMTSAACKNLISKFEREVERVLDDESTTI